MRPRADETTPECKVKTDSEDADADADADESEPRTRQEAREEVGRGEQASEGRGKDGICISDCLPNCLFSPHRKEKQCKPRRFIGGS